MKHSDRNMINRVRGSLIAGAAGDALGYVVEFMGLGAIKNTYGENGITEYDLKPKFLSQSGKGFISDDTQMNLFTANGILMHDANHDNTLAHYVYLAYLDWMMTQTDTDRLMMQTYKRKKAKYTHHTWLYEIPGLHHRRAPGNTCMTALMSGEMGTIKAPLNDSKGCGGVMRAAPVALRYIPENDDDIRMIDTYGAEIAAITHGHDLGWLPAALLTHVIARVMQDCSLPDAIRDAQKVNQDLFSGIISQRHFDEMNDLLERALKLADSKHDDTDNIREIGEGWTGDEALAIALYCALRYPDDLSQALIVSVNHSGDSDSTGAVAGNIIGAMLGYDAIADKWKDNLELKNIILELSDDLCSDSWPEGKYSR
ncbi:MAG: ADP-ribosylglycohydrolase family protein [Synergistaceae bacterium]|nr:ADP-ribosylglycohydrolase family protein [Synergistaceae bacterium]